MRPAVIVVSHTHWDREWYQPFEVFRARLRETVRALLEILDGDRAFRCFMLDGQTVALDDVVAVDPSLAPRLEAHIASGRIVVGPWYVLQDEFLVGAEAIVRNLAFGLRGAARAMRIGYLPDAFGHIAQMPRILRGFALETAVVWRGVGDAAPGSEWRWRAPGGAEVLCLFLPGGYGNAHRLDGATAHEKLRGDLEQLLPMSRAGLILWMNGNDHQPPEPSVPAILDQLTRDFPDVDLEHASLERAAAMVRARVEVGALPVVEGELRRATPSVPVLSGVWSARSWQKRDHDRAQDLLVRFCEPFAALGSLDRHALDHAWRILLQCQPHDSICGCSVDEVHREIDARLARVEQLGGELLRRAVQELCGAPTPDFALHDAIAIVNPHPFAIDGDAEVAAQRPRDQPFRLVGPGGEISYDIISRSPTDGPGGQPAEWLRLRLHARALPPHGLRVIAIEPGAPSPPAAPETSLLVRELDGGIEIVDGEHAILHSFEDEGDRGDLYDFCPVDGPRRLRGGIRVSARAIGRRVEIAVEIDNRTRDHRLRARFDLSAPPASIWTDTPFGWIERSAPGTHPVSTIIAAPGFALGGAGLHEVELGGDGAIRLTLFRAVGWMSRGNLSTRAGHAGYNVETPDAQGLGTLRFRYVVALGKDAVRELEPGLIGPRAVALCRAQPIDRSFLSVENARLSIFKRADAGDAFIVRLCGPPRQAVTARVRLFRPLRAWRSDLDERLGDELEIDGDQLTVEIPPDEIVTLRIV